MTRKRNWQKRYVAGIIFLILLTAVAFGVVLNWEYWNDWYNGINYQPVAEVARIRDELGLTEKGRFLFNAARPELNESSEFNRNCKKDESEVAVLGCYTDKKIFIYNIKEEKLSGIRESTAAHELLHAVWARMDDNKKKDLEQILWQVYADNLDILKEDIETYKESNRLEEIFVRAGTEISTLPESLENIYTEIFVDQDKIVDFYNEYIVVFREIKAEMSELAVEMELLKSEIETKTEEYEKQYNQLEAGIISFNSCAEIVGCFESDSAFYAKRNQLLLEKGTLNLLNEEINELINKYNKKVELYNADVTESYKLQDIINSNKKVEEI